MKIIFIIFVTAKVADGLDHPVKRPKPGKPTVNSWFFFLYLKAGSGYKIHKMRAKFKVDSVTNYGYGGNQKVNMSAVYSSSNRQKEDNQFSEATPIGSLEMMISAKGAINFLKPGVKYILTFEEAEDQA